MKTVCNWTIHGNDQVAKGGHPVTITTLLPSARQPMRRSKA
jgi:hypothetical protein